MLLPFPFFMVLVETPNLNYSLVIPSTSTVLFPTLVSTVYYHKIQPNPALLKLLKAYYSSTPKSCYQPPTWKTGIFRSFYV